MFLLRDNLWRRENMKMHIARTIKKPAVPIAIPTTAPVVSCPLYPEVVSDGARAVLVGEAEEVVDVTRFITVVVINDLTADAAMLLRPESFFQPSLSDPLGLRSTLM